MKWSATPRRQFFFKVADLYVFVLKKKKVLFEFFKVSLPIVDKPDN